MSDVPDIAVAPRPIDAPRALSTASWLSVLGDYIALTKPRLSSLVLAATLAGFLLGSQADTPSILLLHALLGTALVAGSACALNQWMESEPDSRMARTADRPLPAGRLSHADVLFFGIALGAAGTLYLLVAANALAAALAAATLLLYIFVYTPLKRVTTLCLMAGALPGAIPPLIGYAAAHDGLTYAAFLPALLIFFWQYPHFLAISWLYREDYTRGGFQMLSVIDPDGRAVGRHTISRTLAMMLVSLFPSAAGLAGPLYALTATLLGAAFLGFAINLAVRRDKPAARRLFIASIAYLPIVLAVLVLDSTAR